MASVQDLAEEIKLVEEGRVNQAAINAVDDIVFSSLSMCVYFLLSALTVSSFVLYKKKLLHEFHDIFLSLLFMSWVILFSLEAVKIHVNIQRKDQASEILGNAFANGGGM